MTGFSQHRFRALDGWRGICALLVALHHFPAQGFLYGLPLVRNAWLFVDFFFVLSGFVITYAYGARLVQWGEVKSFVVRRFFRLWPLHVAVLGAFVMLEIVGWFTTGTIFNGGRSLYALFTNLFLLQALGLHPGLTWNTPSWSISTEFWTYLIFAAVCVLAPHRRILVSALMIALSIAILVFVSRFGMRETFQWAIARCVYGFFLGSLTFELWSRGWTSAWRGNLAETSAVLIALAFLIFIPGNRALEYLAPPVFALLVLAFANGQGVISRWMDARPVNALGRWSYSIYMVHMLVLALMASALPLRQFFGWQADAITLIYLALVVMLSAFTWRFIEIPGQHLFRRQTLTVAEPSPFPAQ